jgi:hypothetical protein
MKVKANINNKFITQIAKTIKISKSSIHGAVPWALCFKL